MYKLPDITSPEFQRLTLSLARIGRSHPVVGESDPDRVQKNLILRSLVAEPLLIADKPIIDLGSGVGIPGLVLALARPARKVYLLEPKTRCIGLLRWLISKFEDINVEIIHSKLEDADLSGLKDSQIVTRAALDWQHMDRFCPKTAQPFLRWSGPRVAAPPASNKRCWAHLLAQTEHFNQEFYWWGTPELFHVKQSQWNKIEWLTVRTNSLQP